MSFTDRVYEAITGQPAHHRIMPGNTVAMTQAVVKQHGSNSAAGRALGVSEAAIRRWLKGSKPRSGALRGAYLRSQLPAGREADIRAGKIHLLFTQKGGRGERDRDRLVDGAGMRLAAGTGDRVMDAFLAGDIKGAAGALHQGIQDHWYSTNIAPDGVDEGDADYEYGLF